MADGIYLIIEQNFGGEKDLHSGNDSSPYIDSFIDTLHVKSVKRVFL
jgi:hypothetical protein